MPKNAFYKLIPMTSFVIDYYSNEGYADLQTLNLMVNYAQFLKKSLKLEMFVPVGEDGVLLKQPENYSGVKSFVNNDKDRENAIQENKIYRKAEKKCLFEGFELAYNGYSVVRIVAEYNKEIELSFNKKDMLCQNFENIEALTDLEIYLNTNALKKIGIKNKK